MKRNTKIILASLSLLASTATLAPIASPVMAADTTPVVAQNVTKSDAAIQTITMAITKTGTSTPSEAAMFLGNSAKVAMKDGKVSEICIHVDGSKAPMTKGQDMTKMISALSLNGVAGKQANVAKDGSSFDFVFSADAYKEGKGSMECTLNVMGKTMNEKADVVLGKLAENNQKAETAANASAKSDNNSDAAATQTKKATVKKTSKKAKAVKRTLKHNAYVYKKNGKRANKKVLKKGHKVSTYGKAIKLHGKNFYRISKTTYVKKANF